MRVTKEDQKKIKEHEAPIKERALQMYMDGTKNRSKITRKLIDYFVSNITTNRQLPNS